MYSLIVTASSDEWDISPAQFSVSRYLEYTPPALIDQFKLSQQAAQKLCDIPTVFAYESGSGEVARVGWIKDLTWSASTMRFAFEFDDRIPPLDLDAFYQAGHHVGVTDGWELARTHWAIKDVDLPAALEVAGLITPEQLAIFSLPRGDRASRTSVPSPPKPPTQFIGDPPMGVFGDLLRASLSVAAPSAAAVPSRPTSIAGSVDLALHPLTRPDDPQEPLPQKVFVVHGRNEEVKSKVVLFMERIGVETIVLHEQPNAGRTIIEKFDEIASTVGFAVVLMTPDDVGGLTQDQLLPRARQNVVLELGYFIGKLGKKRVCALKIADIEDPSDFLGVLHIKVEGEGWKILLARELHAAGININQTRLLTA
ncbi:TIR domain-containing protein [Luteibacter sp. UNCMF366Tsu5.1]|uniref:TIR domain-containing protein n=1 Tax=Luteibacter sp. UNCMF366Tsu5.1 TaxID=1502758 RepID=UPI000908C6EB|nr:nucleotide-binding protein [Luteibacter sp. UNCMF366Tsu5.1]SFW74438.1 Predicted nucleotide-binding protein containing TIR-like domain-containing protein [Luteibacter sp. UNCMF366Tsu5.1]